MQDVSKLKRGQVNDLAVMQQAKIEKLEGQLEQARSIATSFAKSAFKAKIQELAHLSGDLHEDELKRQLLALAEDVN